MTSSDWKAIFPVPGSVNDKSDIKEAIAEHHFDRDKGHGGSLNAIHKITLFHVYTFRWNIMPSSLSLNVLIASTYHFNSDKFLALL